MVFVNVNKMKYIITESQYKKLTESNEDDFESFLLKRFPKINDLKKGYLNTKFQGPYRRYTDPENDNLYFRVVPTIQPTWEPGKGYSNTDEFVRIYVSPKVYTHIKKYGMNYEYDLMDWFNKTYDENVNAVLRGGPTDK
jgi:hypothetical protein